MSERSSEPINPTDGLTAPLTDGLTAPVTDALTDVMPEAGPAAQLRLLPGGSAPRPRPDWMLDERTRTVGRKGVAEAREILRQARPPEPKDGAANRKAS